MSGESKRRRPLGPLDDYCDELEEEIDQLKIEQDQLYRALALLKEWTHQHGAALKPPGADTYGEGMRDAKRQVAGILSRVLSRIRAEATAPRWPTAEEVTAKALAEGNFIPSSPVLCHPTDPCVHGITGPCSKCQQVCDRLGIDVPAWAAEIRAKVDAAQDQDQPPLRTRDADRIAELEDKLLREQCRNVELDVENELLKKVAKLYDQECGMCGSTGDELVEFMEWKESRDSNATPADLTLPMTTAERSLLQDTEELESRIAALTAELEQSKADFDSVAELKAIAEAEFARLREYAAGCEKTAVLNQMENVQLKLDLATERAAREQAHQLSVDRYTALCEQAQMRAQAERERDTALARMKDLEASNRALRMTNRVEEADADDQRERRRAAETALASARELLAQALMVLVHWNNYQAEEGRSYIPEDENAAVLLRIESWLTSHPAPVAAPSPSTAPVAPRIQHTEEYIFDNDGRPQKHAPSADPDAGTIVGTGWVSRDGANAYGYKTRYREVYVELDSDGDLLVDIEERWGGTGDKCCCTIKASILRALLSRAGLAIVPASDATSPISDETLRHLTECAHSWEPDACLLGNVTARQLQAFCAELAKLRADVPSPEERQVLEAIDGCCKFSLSELHERYPSLGPLADAVGAVRESRRAAKETDHADRSRRETGDW